MFREILIYISAFIACFAVSFYILSYLSVLNQRPKKIPQKDLPKVSIIIPAWNEEKGIGETIESLKKIEYPTKKLEIIVVDDGSKDDTYKVAKQYHGGNVKVYRKKVNGGKYTALNYGIEKSSGEIVVSTDADNLTVSPDALRKMVYYFTDPEVMCVAPSMAISNPKGILNRVQQVEYLLGVFLRKAFGSVNAIHITPGAFSAYRRTFIEKHGGFERAHLTEDMEMALRVQKYHYKIANSIDSVVYTKGVGDFRGLMIQRRRWYVGLIRNFIDYRYLFSPKYGVMGTIVMPVAIVTVALSVILTITMAISLLLDWYRDIRLLSTIDFNLFAHVDFGYYLIERALFDRLSDPMILFMILFFCVLFFYMIFAKKWVDEHTNIKLSIILFIVLYSFLFTFWWVLSTIYAFFFYKSVTWR